MAVKYYSDGTYTKGDGKLYRPGIGVVGNDKSTNVSKAEGGTNSSASSNKTSSNKTTITTMRGTGSGSSNSSTLKENITNSINNPSNGAYSSLSNNSLMKDMVTAYNQSTGSNAKAPTVTSKPVVEEVIEEEELYNPYEDKYNQLKEAYDRQEALLREQNRLAVEQGVNRLNAQKSNINQSADENARQAYVQYMQSQKALPQQLASQGVSGGATETANLGLQTAYQNNVNAINQNKANRLQEIDNAIVDLQNTGDLSTVEQVLANNQAALDAYMNTFDKGVSYNQWAQQFNANREDTMAEQAYRDKVYADQLAQQNRENQWYEQSYKDQLEQYDYEKKQAELDRILQGYYNGYYDVGYTSAQTGIPEEYLYDTKSERELMAKLESANTQSLINNRNNGGKTKTETTREVFDTAFAMLKTDGYTTDDVMRYVWGQGLSETDEMNILSNLGLLGQEEAVLETVSETNNRTTPTNVLSKYGDALSILRQRNTNASSANNSNKTSDENNVLNQSAGYLKGIWDQSSKNKEAFLTTLLNDLKNK